MLDLSASYRETDGSRQTGRSAGVGCFPFGAVVTCLVGMDVVFEYMADHDGVIRAALARELGLGWDREQFLVDRGVIDRPAPGVLRSTSSPVTWWQRVRVAAWAPGDGLVSHGAAARIHELDGFRRYDRVDVLCRKGWWPECPADTITHFTRGNPHADVEIIRDVRVLSVAATLTLFAPAHGLGATAKALDSALRAGHRIDDLRAVAQRWRRRGRPGPATLLMLLDEREGKTLPASWFQRLAKRLVSMTGVDMEDEYPVYADDGRLLARLDLAVPPLRIGVECQSWAWHATPEAQHRDARRRGMLRRMGWEIVDVWWRDLRQPDRVFAELHHLVLQRSSDLSA